MLSIYTIKIEKNIKQLTKIEEVLVSSCLS